MEDFEKCSERESKLLQWREIYPLKRVVSTSTPEWRSVSSPGVKTTLKVLYGKMEKKCMTGYDTDQQGHGDDGRTSETTKHLTNCPKLTQS